MEVKFEVKSEAEWPSVYRITIEMAGIVFCEGRVYNVKNDYDLNWRKELFGRDFADELKSKLGTFDLL